MLGNAPVALVSPEVARQTKTAPNGGTRRQVWDGMTGEESGNIVNAHRVPVSCLHAYHGDSSPSPTGRPRPFLVSGGVDGAIKVRRHCLSTCDKPGDLL
jgi:hypothetical protein